MDKTEKMTVTFNESMPEMLNHLSDFSSNKAKADRVKLLAFLGLKSLSATSANPTVAVNETVPADLESDDLAKIKHEDAVARFLETQ